MLRLGRVIAALLAMWAVATDASAASITIVAVGASNTSGWGVPQGSAYPEQLQVLLRAKGVDAHVINAGRPFDTTGGMLGRIDEAVPNGDAIMCSRNCGARLLCCANSAARSCEPTEVGSNAKNSAPNNALT